MKLTNDVSQPADSDLNILADPKLLSVYAAGTVYTLTNAAAAIDFGTTDPSLTLTGAGKYLIKGRARFEAVGATFGATQAITLKLRRTNNTPADLTSGSGIFNVPVMTTLTNTIGYIDVEVIYTTANADDVIALFGHIAVLPSAGSVTVDAASIIAVRLAA